MVAGWMDAPVVVGVDPITLVAANIVLRILACCIIVSCALYLQSILLMCLNNYFLMKKINPN